MNCTKITYYKQKFYETDCNICYCELLFPAAYLNCLHEFCINCIIECMSISNLCPYCKVESDAFVFDIENKEYRSLFIFNRLNYSMIIDKRKKMLFFMNNKKMIHRTVKKLFIEFFSDKTHYHDIYMKKLIYFCNLCPLIPSHTSPSKRSRRQAEILADNEVWSWLEREFTLLFCCSRSQPPLSDVLALQSGGCYTADELEANLQSCLSGPLMELLRPHLRCVLRHDGSDWLQQATLADISLIWRHDGSTVVQDGTIHATALATALTTAMLRPGREMLASDSSRTEYFTNWLQCLHDFLESFTEAPLSRRSGILSSHLSLQLTALVAGNDHAVASPLPVHISGVCRLLLQQELQVRKEEADPVEHIDLTSQHQHTIIDLTLDD